jgi:hypothetical protein
VEPVEGTRTDGTLTDGVETDGADGTEGTDGVETDGTDTCGAGADEVSCEGSWSCGTLTPTPATPFALAT